MLAIAKFIWFGINKIFIKFIKGHIASVSYDSTILIVLRTFDTKAIAAAFLQRAP